jgi:hypothetical protein
MELSTSHSDEADLKGLLRRLVDRSMELAAIGDGPTVISGELLLAEILNCSPFTGPPPLGITRFGLEWRAWIGTIVTSRAHSIVGGATRALPGAAVLQTKLDGDAFVDIGHAFQRQTMLLRVVYA